MILHKFYTILLSSSHRENSRNYASTQNAMRMDLVYKLKYLNL